LFAKEQKVLKNKLISRDLTVEDCARLPSLVRKVWNVDTTENYWKWKYFDCPFKIKCIVIENKDGDIVAIVSFWLRPAKFGSKVFSPGTIVDIMVAPKFRGGKAFGFIMKRIDMEIIKKIFIFGFPNPISHKLFLIFFGKYKAIDTNISIFVSVVNAGVFINSIKPVKKIAGNISRSFQKLHLRINRNKRILVQQVKAIGDEFDKLWEDVSREYYWIQNRGKDYIQWRYQQHPIHKYQIWKATEDNRIVGYLITTINKEPDRVRGMLIDWLVSRNRNDIFKEMLKTSCYWLVNQKVDLIETWLMHHEKQWLRVLKSNLFLKSKRSRLLLMGGGPDYNDPNFRKIDNFFFTIGDSDYLGAVNF